MVLEKVKSRLSKSRQKSDHITALDIGTEYVKVLIGKYTGDETDQKVEIIGVGRAHQKLSDMQSGAIADIAGVVDNCDKALNIAEDMAGVTARDAVVGIAGELVKGGTTTIKYRRPDPRRSIEKTELAKIIEQVQKRAKERAKAQLAWESGTEDVEIKMVNAAVVSVMIDGYKVNNPIGFQGRDVSVQLFSAFAPMVHIGAIERVVYDLDLNLLNVAAEPYAVAKSVGADMGESFSAVFIDVGGGTSDIALVNDGGVEGTKMFGIGGRAFTASIAQKLNLPISRAEQLKLEYSQGNLRDDQAAKVNAAIVPTLEVWQSGVELALSEFENIDHLPSKILLCGGGTSLPDLLKILKEDTWRKNLPFTRDIQVSHIQPAQVDRVKDNTQKANDHTYITPMGLLNIGLDMRLSGGLKQSILNKLNRTMSA